MEPSPEPLAWWDLRFLPALHARGQWFFYFGLEYRWYYGSMVLGGVVGKTRGWCLCFHSTTAGKSPSVTAFRAISDSAIWKALQGENRIYSWFLHQQIYPGISERALDMGPGSTFWVMVLSLSNYKNLSKSCNFQRDIPYHSVTAVI